MAHLIIKFDGKHSDSECSNKQHCKLQYQKEHLLYPGSVGKGKFRGQEHILLKATERKHSFYKSFAVHKFALAQNRFILNGSSEYDVAFSCAISARIFPVTGAVLKPCPENQAHHQKQTYGNANHFLNSLMQIMQIT
jgi:hypothetical protein